MSAWCMAHPWMTFFVAMSAVGAVRQLGRSVVVVVKGVRGKGKAK